MLNQYFKKLNNNIHLVLSDQYRFNSVCVSKLKTGNWPQPAKYVPLTEFWNNQVQIAMAQIKETLCLQMSKTSRITYFIVISTTFGSLHV